MTRFIRKFVAVGVGCLGLAAVGCTQQQSAAQARHEYYQNLTREAIAAAEIRAEEARERDQSIRQWHESNEEIKRDNQLERQTKALEQIASDSAYHRIWDK